jgi:putative addiction module component (TIGR02574 family)
MGVVTRARGLLEEALRLPPKERANLAGHLILSLHPRADADSEAAWATEIDRRLDAFEASKAKSLAWPTLRRSIAKAQRARARRKTRR